MKLGLIFTCWLVAAIVGFGYTMVWSYSPGESARVSRPKETSGIYVQAIIHPLCPCSTATLNLLRQAVEGSPDQLSIEVIFSGEPQVSKNVRLAKSISGAEVTFATESELQKRFGSATSGHISVWKSGKLAFSGGITDARGESAKGTAFQQFLEALKGESARTSTPTYGCPVLGGR